MKDTVTLDNITLIHGDCMDYMAGLEAGAFDLGIPDPPYGIGMDGGNVGYKGFNDLPKKGWDKEIPPPEYFNKLFKVTEEQIVWGGNYFPLPPSRCFLVWDKGEGFYNRTYAECELAWVSIDGNARIFKYDPLANGDYRGKIHPTQKPVALYRWLLQNYAKPGQTIIDTHLGSGSSAIAAWEMGHPFVGIEIDRGYFDAAVARLKKRMKQPYLPMAINDPVKVEQPGLFNSPTPQRRERQNATPTTYVTANFDDGNEV